MHTANELEDAPVMPGLGTTLFDVSVESDKVVAHFFFGEGFSVLLFDLD
jgi:hypothetical protein